ncbi:YhcN/YlaJ family sporulation lipoprotein [Tumebacillus lipolyticus]|uniref:YhcN/YlaJ family sporulation lipoprotein n=1 Tax=Tumebacillus lipolyticus TaxID=1280370 RepID=A0ABW4ZS83_9BACL
MNRYAKYATTSLIALSLCTALFGCNRSADYTRQPARETNETRADQGVRSYSGYRPPAEDRQLSADPRNSAVRTSSRKPYSAHGMANELASLSAVKSAAVIVADKSVYVGVTSSGVEELPSDLPAAISAKIRQMDRSIAQVYITVDRRAVQVISDYSRALEGGLPLDGYEGQFREVRQSRSWVTGS